MSGEVFSSEDSESFANNNLLFPLTRGEKKEEVQQVEHSASSVKCSRTAWSFPKIADRAIKVKQRFLFLLPFSQQSDRLHKGLTYFISIRRNCVCH